MPGAHNLALYFYAGGVDRREIQGDKSFMILSDHVNIQDF